MHWAQDTRQTSEAPKLHARRGSYETAGRNKASNDIAAVSYHDDPVRRTSHPNPFLGSRHRADVFRPQSRVQLLFPPGTGVDGAAVSCATREPRRPGQGAWPLRQPLGQGRGTLVAKNGGSGGPGTRGWRPGTPAGEKRRAFSACSASRAASRDPAPLPEGRQDHGFRRA